jgi:hypothetical protein
LVALHTSSSFVRCVVIDFLLFNDIFSCIGYRVPDRVE